jgi:hypothetical protein
MKNEALQPAKQMRKKWSLSQFSIFNSQFWLHDRGALLITALFLLLLIPLSLPRIALSDEVQYYVYLRSIYFDGDLDFSNEYEHFAAIGRQNGDLAIDNALLRRDAQNPNPETGKLRNVAPVGSAIMWAPGFVAADALVRAANRFGAGIPADGYSRPYIWSVCYMSALYALGGLLLSYRLARRFVGVFAATLATLAIFLATPLVMYTYVLMPWSHATGFFLFALFMTIWLRGAYRDAHGDSPTTGSLATFRAQRSIGGWIVLGLVGALMTMTREQLGLLLLLPAIESIVSYVNLWRERRWTLVGGLLVRNVLFLAVVVLALTPQLVAYQVLNGHLGPSSTVGGKLDWCSPHMIDTLIDYDPRPSAWCAIANDPTAGFPPFAHGAFVWSPILVPAVLGLALLWRRDRLLVAVLGLAFLAQVYINGVIWPTWHLSGAFGFRRLIECSPIFVLGLAMLLDALSRRAGPNPDKRRVWPLLLAAIFLVYWNIGLIAQWTIMKTPERNIRTGLVWDDMLRYQFVEVPRTVASKVDDVIFHRCRLAQNQNC